MRSLGLQIKLLSIVIGISSIGFLVLIYLVIDNERTQLILEEKRAVELMSLPILESIYSDMNDSRAEITRHLINGLKKTKLVERALIVKGNGVDEAFLDLKTIRAVQEKIGVVRDEWIAGHPDSADAKAPGTDTDQFKAAFDSFLSGNTEGVGYMEEYRGKSLYTYVVPVEERTSCLGCHDSQGARGYLMISSSLDDMLESIAQSRNRWLGIGILTIGSVSFLLLLLTQKFVSMPLSELLLAAKIISKGHFNHRVKISTGGEVGELGTAMNEMAAELERTYTDLETKVEVKSGDLAVACEELETAHTELKKVNAELKSKAVGLESANMDLARTNQEWEDLERLKTEFLQTMSNELRSPLTPILGYLELFRDNELGTLTDVQREVISEMHLCGKTLLMVIDELLEAATIQSGTMFLDLEDVDIYNILNDVVTDMMKYADEDHIEIASDFAGKSLRLEGDKKRLTEIFTHLLRNAVKFSGKRSVVNLRTNHTEDGIEVIIADKGVGISPDRLTLIFDAFYQFNSSKAKQYEGVGLGLYLVKKLVDIHSGKISVTSELDKGTTFTVYLPLVPKDGSVPA